MNQADVPENTGIFSIGPKKLAKVCNTDASHNSEPGRDEYKNRLLGSRLVQNYGGVEGIAELIKTNLETGIDVSSIKDR